MKLNGSQAAKNEAEAKKISEGTKEELIKSAAISNWKSTLEGLESSSKITLNEQQVSKLKNDMAVAWANVGLGEQTVTNQADKIANDLMMGIRDLDRKDQELLKDWIYEGVRAGKEISGEIMNWMTRGTGKQITTVAGKIEEMFNGEGESIGTKTVQEQVTKTTK